jgi:Domain of unknown function (DUF4158)
MKKVWEQYGEPEETRREHFSELRAFLGLTPFGLRQFHQSARWLAELAMQTDKGVVLATALVQEVRREKVLLPPIDVIERVCALAITRANRKIYLILVDALNDGHRILLEGLLRQPTGSDHRLRIENHSTYKCDTRASRSIGTAGLRPSAAR